MGRGPIGCGVGWDVGSDWYTPSSRWCCALHALRAVKEGMYLYTLSRCDCRLNIIPPLCKCVLVVEGVQNIDGAYLKDNTIRIYTYLLYRQPIFFYIFINIFLHHFTNTISTSFYQYLFTSFHQYYFCIILSIPFYIISTVLLLITLFYQYFFTFLLILFFNHYFLPFF